MNSVLSSSTYGSAFNDLCAMSERIPTHTAGFISKRANNTQESGIRRFFEIAATMQDVISLGIGEPDFVSPQPVIDAVITSLHKGQTGYTANAGLLHLRRLISENLERCYGISYSPQNQIVVTVGGSEAMLIAMLATIDPGDEVLIPEPCFVSYGPLAEFAGAKVVYIPTRVETGFQVTAEDIAARITPRSKLLFIGYPSNPTGAVLRRETLEDIAKVVIENDLIVLSDEIYDRLVYGRAAEEGHVSLPSLDGLYERTILTGGFSKNHAMTGWRVGYACAPEALSDAMYKMHQYVVMCSSTMGQVGAVAALETCDADVERMRRSYDERRRFIVDGLRAAGLPTFEPEGAFYCFPDITSTGLSSEAFVERLLAEEQVACVPGDAFGPSGAGYVRCSYATAMDKLEEAVRRITRFAERRRA